MCNFLTLFVVLFALSLAQNLGLNVDVGVEINALAADVKVLALLYQTFLHTTFAAVRTFCAKDIGFKTTNGWSRTGIDVNRNEKVALVLFGNLCTLRQ